eukprot:TRINITY_DN1623_c0_g1_i4.p1 TRINITY_DN1623_c0_g1~~TRINITY_DN1623_c0_g1_i4.p1  ORF type:complete len:221 (-),score=58.24 TRINITY_DN1623_c0_g1_i4:66-728(-)
MDQVQAGAGWQAVLTALAPLAKQFDAVYGSHWGSLRNFVGRVPDHLMMMECHDMTDLIPTALDAQYRSELYHQYDQWWVTNEMSRPLALVQLGRFLNLLNTNLQRAATQNSTEYKLRVFMGHEFSIGSLMVLLGAPIGACVPWGAHVQLQLLQGASDTDLAVRVLFDGRAVQLTGCSAQVCPLEQWSEAMASTLGEAQQSIRKYCNQTLVQTAGAGGCGE